MNHENAMQSAALLSAGRLTHIRLGPLPGNLRPSDEDEAYSVQDALHKHLIEAGLGTIVGHKIGCTTPVMQQFLGIHNPCAGAVFESTACHVAGTYNHDDLLHPGVECEIAVRLGSDLPLVGQPYDHESVASAIGAVMCAIEVVDDRWADYRSIDTPTLIADDFFGAGCVLGVPVIEWRSCGPSDIIGSMSINGEVVGTGVGRDIMGHPFRALAWLANLMGKRGLRLRAGEFILLGSIVETHWVEKGDVVTIELEGLGKATARFA